MWSPSVRAILERRIEPLVEIVEDLWVLAPGEAWIDHAEPLADAAHLRRCSDLVHEDQRTSALLLRRLVALVVIDGLVAREGAAAEIFWRDDTRDLKDAIAVETDAALAAERAVGAGLRDVRELLHGSSFVIAKSESCSTVESIPEERCGDRRRVLDDAVAEDVDLIGTGGIVTHPGGSPIIHSTKAGFRRPPPAPVRQG